MKPISILIIEDNELSNFFTQNLIKHFRLPIDVHFETSSEAGLGYLETRDTEFPDYILSDIHLPMIDGFTFIELVQDSFPLLSLNTEFQIMTTNRFSQFYQEKMNALNIQKFLHKPLQVKHFKSLLLNSTPVSIA
ncbi:MAG: response regulator [Bacteroidota bacterium]